MTDEWQHGFVHEYAKRQNVSVSEVLRASLDLFEIWVKSVSTE